MERPSGPTQSEPGWSDLIEKMPGDGAKSALEEAHGEGLGRMEQAMCSLMQINGDEN